MCSPGLSLVQVMKEGERTSSLVPLNYNPTGLGPNLTVEALSPNAVTLGARVSLNTVWGDVSIQASLIAQLVKNLPAVQETGVRSLHWEDPLEKEMGTHSSILAWKISWTEEPGGL